MDWVSTEAVPETSSDGTVESITPAADGVVTATYTQGSAEYFHPSVGVVDNEDAPSASASAQLGISDWVDEVISSSAPEFEPDWGEVGFDVMALAENPQTGELVIAGQNKDTTFYSDIAEGVYWAVRQADGSWDEELVFGFDHPLWKAWDEQHQGARTRASDLHIAAWDSDGYPLIILTGVSDDGAISHVRVWASSKAVSGDWELEEVFKGTAPDTNRIRGAAVVDTESWGANGYVALLRDIEVANGIDDYSYRDYLYWYDEGIGELEDTQWVADQDNSRFTRLIKRGGPHPLDRISGFLGVILSVMPPVGLRTAGCCCTPRRGSADSATGASSRYCNTRSSRRSPCALPPRSHRP